MSMVNVKRSTSVNPAQQQSSMKSEGVNTESAGEFQKAFGDQAMGDVLNKIADPNWVDPTKKMRVAGDNQLDKDAFLKLMLAQMKHQDPTNPMQSHEMAAQLAQFTSLEQLNNINTNLEGLKQQQAPSMNYQALALIGKKVSGDNSKLTRAAGDTSHAFGFELLGDAQNVSVSIKDGAGNLVRKLDFTDMKKGRRSVEWNGLNEQGMPARAGEYKFTIEAKSSTGSKVFAKTAFEGRINGLNYTNEGPVLLVDGQSVKLSEVRKIEDAGPMMPQMMQQMMPPMPPAIPLGAGSAAPTKLGAAMTMGANSSAPVNNGANDQIPAAEEAEPASVGNIQDVPMAREMLEKVAKGV